MARARTAVHRPAGVPGRVLSTVLAAVLASGVVAGCAALADPGPARSEDRPVEGTRAVRLETGGTLTVVAGADPRLTVHAGAAVLADLTSEVTDGVLVLGARSGARRLGKVGYDLVLPRLESLTLAGSGDVTAHGVSAERMTLRIDGSGDLTATGLDVQALTVLMGGSGDAELAGTTDHQDVTVQGSGDYRAEDLPASDAHVTADGSGDVVVSVTGTLRVLLSGSGDVVYTGEPVVEATDDGSGVVRSG